MRANDSGECISPFSALLFAGASLGPQLAGALSGPGLRALRLVLAAVPLCGAALAAASRR